MAHLIDNVLTESGKFQRCHDFTLVAEPSGSCGAERRSPREPGGSPPQPTFHGSSVAVSLCAKPFRPRQLTSAAATAARTAVMTKSDVCDDNYELQCKMEVKNRKLKEIKSSGDFYSFWLKAFIVATMMVNDIGLSRRNVDVHQGHGVYDKLEGKLDIPSSELYDAQRIWPTPRTASSATNDAPHAYWKYLDLSLIHI